MMSTTKRHASKKQASANATVLKNDATLRSLQPLSHAQQLKPRAFYNLESINYYPVLTNWVFTSEIKVNIRSKNSA